MNQTTSQSDQWVTRVTPTTPADALGHLVTHHGWEVQPIEPSLLQAHRYAHGADGRPDLADTDLTHGHEPISYQPQPQPPPNPYGYGYVQPQPRTNGLAVASLVLGICWVWWIGSILAIIFGVVAHRQIRESNGAQTGGGMATAGVVLGWIGCSVIALLVIIAVVGAATSSSGGY